MKQTLITILFTLALFNLRAQNEGNIWYFGQYAGIDFNNDPPTILSNSAMSTNEGCSSISDQNGSLLFYTDGVTIWNRNHNPMPNGTGLDGHASATQSAVIVKQPGTFSTYYVFTSGAQGSNGIKYSVVDMSLQGGLGDVGAAKNILVLNNTHEKIAAVLHQNNTDFWIIVQSDLNHDFHTYLLSSTGLNTTPVLSSIVTNSGVLGYMKASPDGSKVASANQDIPQGTHYLYIFDFNKTSGTLSNPILLSNTPDPYGIEFSPNSQLLYVQHMAIINSPIIQYNLMAGSSTAIINSATQIGTVPFFGGALQLAPNGKIYGTQGSDTLSVINNPNTLSLGCNFVSNGLYIGPGTNGLGLPNFYNSIFAINFSYSQLCFGDSTCFFSPGTAAASNLNWNFGDPTTGANNQSNLLNPKHLFSGIGFFQVQLFITNGTITDTLTDSIYINPQPNVNLGNDTTLCQGEILILDATTLNATYLWQDNSTNPTINVTQQGTYWVVVSNDSCSASDTITVNYHPIPTVDFGNDSTLCQGETLILDATTPNATYLWQDNSTNPTFNVTQQGTYWVVVSNGSCSSTDTIIVNYNPIPTVHLGNDTMLCQGETLILDATTPNSTYLWQDYSTNPTFNVTQQGMYWVVVSNGSCSATDTTNVIDEKCDIILIIPNIFTPNQDGINDLFVPSLKDGVTSIYTQIFNKWGQLIFSSNFIEIGWDGKTTSGTIVPDGTYYWIINYVDINGKKNNLKGYLTILR